MNEYAHKYSLKHVPLTECIYTHLYSIKQVPYSTGPPLMNIHAYKHTNNSSNNSPY